MTIAVGWIFFGGAIGLCLIGIAGVVLSRHLFRMVLGLAIAEAGANLMLVLAGYRWDAVAPILSGALDARPMVDPVPQAMVLTAIVIGVGVQALALSLAIQVRRRYATLDMPTALERMRRELDRAAGVPPTRSQEQPAGERPLAAATAITDGGPGHD